ncbi:SRPBCC family protein [Geodermatophilus normandii]|uniref:SRPBCC family protein n=1 Tax=Geodermatophilus normandii TaxID=1137989 RepID=A0A6P0GMM9_9ACTN|nr:SRPBCC family protein [Geodermatophilus normandii]NEM08516.1 SRPBCC family protein [Geodermatophilus normandii]
MARVEATVDVPVEPAPAFAVSQTTGATRYRWDAFVRAQSLLDGRTRPGEGVRTATRSRHGLAMVSRYVSYVPPSHVGMRMPRGPWFFAVFAGSRRFTPLPDGSTRAVWRHVLRCRAAWLAPVAEQIGTRLLGRDTRRRIAGFARGCADPAVLAVARRELEEDAAGR